ncbi:MAG: NAD(P)-dependent oxidoreductase [Muribaculaceae bacterium]|nr:NAD(P)-dependent oxidoreductase [Muribaculaceae bacterium]
MKNIIITGGRGLLASELTHRLLADGNWNIFLVSRSPQDIRPANHLQAIELAQLVNDKALRNLSYDALVHTAFSRSLDGEDLKKSLDFLTDVLAVAKQLELKSFINISSQGVYGTKHNENVSCDETMSLSPGDNYSIAKAFSEVMVNSGFANSNINHTNIRLASILSHKESKRFVNILVDHAKHQRDINISGGNQHFSFIDIDDASQAITTMLNYCDKKWEPVYNLGTGLSHSLLEIAIMVADIAKREYGYEISIHVLPATNDANMKLSVTRFSTDFFWHPQCSLESSIEKLFKNQ